MRFIRAAGASDSRASRSDGSLFTKIVEDREVLARTLDSFARHGKILIGYNSKRFDVPLIRGILGGIDAYELCQALIGDDREVVKDLLWSTHPPRFRPDTIDIAERLRKGRYPQSLKSLAASMGRPKLQELPFEPGTVLTDEQWAQVKQYNLIDLGLRVGVGLERVSPDLMALSVSVGGDGTGP